LHTYWLVDVVESNVTEDADHHDNDAISNSEQRSDVNENALETNVTWKVSVADSGIVEPCFEQCDN